MLVRPLEGPQGFDYPFTVEGRSREEQSGNPFLNYEAVTPDYFRATGLQVVQGRAFSEADRADAPRVVILGRSVARRLWPGADPVGRRIKWGGPDSPSPWVTVVGVVEDGRYRGLETVCARRLRPPYPEPLAAQPSRAPHRGATPTRCPRRSGARRRRSTPASGCSTSPPWAR